MADSTCACDAGPDYYETCAECGADLPPGERQVVQWAGKVFCVRGPCKDRWLNKANHATGYGRTA